MRIFLGVLLACIAFVQNVESFGIHAPLSLSGCHVCHIPCQPARSQLHMADDESEAELTEEEKQKAVGNLVADDEWNGLSMELSETIRTAVVEDIKKNTREFLGKDEYKLGDITKEVDTRVKDEVARFRGKEDYELGDFTMAMDEMTKMIVEDMTGKPYEVGDLSKEIDSRVKNAVANFCGKDEYEVGDLSSEIDRRVKDRVMEFTGKDDYQFGDIAREVMVRRQAWAKEFLGAEAAENYKFGDLTKKAITNFTGKDDYEFGDLSKKLFGSMFNKKKDEK